MGGKQGREGRPGKPRRHDRHGARKGVFGRPVPAGKTSGFSRPPRRHALRSDRAPAGSPPQRHAPSRSAWLNTGKGAVPGGDRRRPGSPSRPARRGRPSPARATGGPPAPRPSGPRRPRRFSSSSPRAPAGTHPADARRPWSAPARSGPRIPLPGHEHRVGGVVADEPLGRCVPRGPGRPAVGEQADERVGSVAEER